MLHYASFTTQIRFGVAEMDQVSATSTPTPRQAPNRPSEDTKTIDIRKIRKETEKKHEEIEHIRKRHEELRKDIDRIRLIQMRLNHDDLPRQDEWLKVRGVLRHHSITLFQLGEYLIQPDAGNVMSFGERWWNATLQWYYGWRFCIAFKLMCFRAWRQSESYKPEQCHQEVMPRWGPDPRKCQTCNSYVFQAFSSNFCSYVRF